MRKGAVTFVVGCIFALGALVAAPSAFADLTRSNPAFDADGNITPDAWEIIQNPNRFPPPQPIDGSLPTTTQGRLATLYERMRMAGRVMPSFATMLKAGGTVAIFAGANELYQEAYQMNIPGQGTIYRAVSGMDWDPTPSGNQTFLWQISNLAGNAQCPTTTGGTRDGYATNTIPDPKTLDPVTHAVTGTLSCTWNSGYFPTVIGTNGGALDTEYVAMVAAGTNTSSWNYCLPVGTNYTTGSSAQMHAMPIGIEILTGAGSGGFCAPANAGYVRVATAEQLLAASQGPQIKEITQNTYNNYASGNKRSFTYTQPTFNSTDAANAAAVIIPGTGTQTVDQEAAECALAKEVNPAYTCTRTAETGGSGGAGSTVIVTIPQIVTTETFRPFVIPRPSVNESYGDYIERLRNLGWLGDATVGNEATSFPAGSTGASLIPESVTRVTVGASEAVRYNLSTGAATWPQNAPKVTSANQTISITKVSGSRPQSGAGGGLDFDPLTSLDGACSFPFGFICYALEVTGWFDVSADAPVFSFDLSGFDTPVGSMSLGTYGPVDLNVIDPYMTVFRTLIAIALWIGAVYLLATRLLGFRAGGDPGAAMDEVMEV